jgi:hypothetical protein
MNARSLALGLGTAVTTFLLVAAAAIEFAPAAWGDSPGVGIVGVLVGLVLGLAAGAAVTFGVPIISRAVRAAVVGYAALGVTYLGIAAMRYVNVPGADDVFTFPVHLGVSLLVAVVAAVLVIRRPDTASRANPS